MNKIELTDQKPPDVKVGQFYQYVESDAEPASFNGRLYIVSEPHDKEYCLVDLRDGSVFEWPNKNILKIFSECRGYFHLITSPFIVKPDKN